MSDEERFPRSSFLTLDAEAEGQTSGGGAVYDFAEPQPDGPAEKDPVLASELEHHLAAHLGPVEEVFHGAKSDVVEVLRVGPTDGWPFHVLVTCGLAQVAMGGEPRFAELLLSLPVDWSFDDADVEGEGGWPIRLLQELSRGVHEDGAWLGPAQVVPHGQDGESYGVDTHLCACIVETPAHLPPDLHRLCLSDGRRVRFLGVTPLFADEVDYQLVFGAEALLERFDELRHLRVVDPQRPCVVHPDLPGAASEARDAVRGTPWWRHCH